MKRIVGVMPLWDDEKDSIWMLPGYMDGLHQAGGIPIIFPLQRMSRKSTGLCICATAFYSQADRMFPLNFIRKHLWRGS